MELSHLRAGIERMRVQIGRQKKEIKALEQAGISTVSAYELLARLRAKVDVMCEDRDRQLFEERKKISRH